MVVGSRGYLGPHVVKLLQEASHDVIEVDAGFWGQSIPAGVYKGHHVHPSWVREKQVDAIVYLGAIAHDPEGLVPEEAHYRHTRDEPIQLAWTLEEIPFVFASSLSVFDKGAAIYPHCKRCAEARLFQLPNTSILRFGTLYGPGVTPEYYRPHLLLNRMVYTALKSGKVEVFNPSARRPVLSVIDAAWHIAAETCVMLGGGPGRKASNHYMACATILEYGQRVCAVTGAELVVSDKPSPDTRDYGWGTYDLDYLDLIPLLNWTREHLDEIDLTRKQVIP